VAGLSHLYVLKDGTITEHAYEVPELIAGIYVGKTPQGVTMVWGIDDNLGFVMTNHIHLLSGIPAQ